MALHRRDPVGDTSNASKIFTVVGIPTSALGETSTVSVKLTSSSTPSTTSAKTTSTLKSTSSSTAKSTNPTSSSTKSAAASTITSSSSTASDSTVTSSSRPSSNSSPSSSSTTRSSTTSTSIHSTTLTSTSTSTSTSTPTSTVTPNSAASTASGNSISGVGVAVAVIFTLLIISGSLYLLWKYLPAARRYRERAYIARSHREGLSFSEPNKGPAFTDEESAHDRDAPLDDPKLGMGLRRFDYHGAPTHQPGEPRSYGLGSDAHRDPSQRRPLASASPELERAASPPATRSDRPRFSFSALPSALQAGPARHVPQPHQLRYQYRDARAREIGAAVPLTGGGSGSGNSRSGSRERDFQPVPLPSVGYGRPLA